MELSTRLAEVAWGNLLLSGSSKKGSTSSYYACLLGTALHIAMMFHVTTMHAMSLAGSESALQVKSSEVPHSCSSPLNAGKLTLHTQQRRQRQCKHAGGSEQVCGWTRACPGLRGMASAPAWPLPAQMVPPALRRVLACPAGVCSIQSHSFSPEQLALSPLSAFQSHSLRQQRVPATSLQVFMSIDGAYKARNKTHRS